ncbi:MAG: DUF4214 domain-containing protein [Neptuniibacter sp.]
MSSEDLMRFDIADGQVTAVYEYNESDGIWELEDIDDNKSYNLSGDDIVETEIEDGFVETKVFRDRGDGIYQRISSETVPIDNVDDSSSSDDSTDDSSSDDSSDDDSSSDDSSDGIVTALSDDLMRFDIVNGEVTAVYEYDEDDGVWELESMDDNKTYIISGSDITETEVNIGYIETKVFRDLGDGVYVEISSNSVVTGDSSIPEDSSDDSEDQYVIIDGLLFEEDDSIEYPFDLTVDGDYLVGDDFYIVRDGKIYELEDDGFYHKSGQSVSFNGENYEVELFHDSLDSSSDDSDEMVAKSFDGTRREIESSEEAIQEDGSIFRLYQAIFDRTPDGEGFHYWGERLDVDLDFDEVVERFLESNEFKTVYEGTDDLEFLIKLYNNVLDRDPDEDGLNWWHNELSEGLRERDEVVIGFSESGEFVEKTEIDFDDFVETVGQTSITTDMII